MSRVTIYDVVDMQEVYQLDCKHKVTSYELHDDNKGTIWEEVKCIECNKLMNTNNKGEQHGI